MHKMLAAMAAVYRRIFFCLEIALLLGEDAAAVFLNVHAKLPRTLLPGAEQRAEIAVEERHAVFGGGTLCDLAQQLVVLIRADEQRGGKGIKAALFGLVRGGIQAHGVALDAAAVDVLGHGADKGAPGRSHCAQERSPDGGGVVAQAVAAAAIFRARGGCSDYTSSP